jgi:hypothetical protein
VVVDRFLRRSGSRVSILIACRRTVPTEHLASVKSLYPLGQPEKAIGHEPQIDLCVAPTGNRPACQLQELIPRRRYRIKMEPRWKKKISEFLEMIPPLRGGDFQGIAGLSSDDSLLIGVNSARATFYEGPRAVKHRLDEPGQIIPQHGCVPALPASVSPGSGNFSRKPRLLGAAQVQASVIAHRGAGSQATVLRFRSGEKYFLDIPLL